MRQVRRLIQTSNSVSGTHYKAFLNDVTATILVFQNNKTAAMLVFKTNPARVKLFFRVINRPFPSSPGPLYQNEVKCSAFDNYDILMEIKLIFTGNVVLKVKVFGTRKWPISFVLRN